MMDETRLTFEVMAASRKEIESVVVEGWVHNIPFTLVPPEIVGGFRGQLFTPNEFYFSDEWRMPNHWNAAFVRNGEIVIFMYGRFHSLEKYLYVERIGACRSIQAYGGRVWELAISEGERIARQIGCRYIWTATGRKGEVRKFFNSIAGTGAVLNPPSNTVIRKDLKYE